jgi:hypothetical protein
MIAVALGLLGLVVMIATGVAASSTAGDHLTFLGIGVQTTTAQVFMTGAIFGWVFVIALWLLRVGIHRSGERCAQLAQRRSRRASEWLGFGEADAEAGQDGDGWGGWDEWGGLGRETRGARARFRIAASASDVDSDSAQPTRIVGWTGAAGDRRAAPGCGDGGADQAYRAGAGTGEQPGPVGGGHAAGPVAGDLVGLGVGGGAERGEVGGGSGAVAGEDGGSEGEGGSGECCQ